MLLPRQPDHDAQPMAQRRVEDPPRGRGVRANSIDAVRRHRLEIALDPFGRPETVAVACLGERAVGDAPDPEPVVADCEKLAVDANGS